MDLEMNLDGGADSSPVSESSRNIELTGASFVTGPRDDLTRKTRITPGHKGSVTRSLGELKDAVEVVNFRKLKQLQRTFKKKVKTLDKLDEGLSS